MRIVLHEGISGLGSRGDLVNVSDGYGRNFLIPQGKAQLATAGVEAQAESMRKSWQLKNAKNREAAEEIAKLLVARSIIIPARAGAGGKLFGSITTADIATAIVQQTEVELGRKMLTLDEGIRTLGTHMVTAQPHTDVQFPVTVEVIEA